MFDNRGDKRRWILGKARRITKGLILLVASLMILLVTSNSSKKTMANVVVNASASSTSALVLSPEANANVTMKVSGGVFETLDNTKGGQSTTPGADVSSWEEWKASDKTYMKFLPGVGMHGVGLTGLGQEQHGDNPTGYPTAYNITLDYDNVGYYNFGLSNAPDLQKIGARINISDIQYGSNPSWASRTVPYILFSNNLYSGVKYGRIKSMKITMTFYRVSDNQVINFDGKNAVFSFNSLNSAQGTFNPLYSAEFAGSGSNNGSLTVDSLLQYHPDGIQGADYTKNTYFGDTNNFDDQLGSDSFPKASVTFPLAGTSNSFVFGSTWGSAWNSFSSSANYPTGQSAPSKTVEPLKQYQSGDTWNNPTGATAEFAQRYDNDLDRYNDGSGLWSYQNAQTGHDPDNNDLNAGIPAKADRYVETGKEYYYYINQPTINLQTQGLILPDGYEIDDTLPEGTEVEDVKLYNLDGTLINNAFKTQPQVGTKNLTLELNNSATQAINTLSKQTSFYGKDFTVRVTFKVTNTTSDNIEDLMANQASSKFFYNSLNNGSGNYYTATSNLVHIRVKDVIQTLNFKKVTEDGSPLQGAEFDLFAPNGDKVNDTTITSDSNGLFRVSSKKFEDGNYKLSETKAPVGYEKQDYMVQIKDAKIVGGDVSGDGKVIDKKQAAKLILKKRDKTSHNMLAGAEFTIYKQNSNQLGDPVKKVKTGDNGAATVDGLDWETTYWAVETKAPDGYKLPDPQDINNWQLVSFDKSELTKELIFDDEMNVLNIRLQKVDSLTNKQLAGAIFELTGPDGYAQTQESTDSHDADYNLQFTELVPGQTYTLKENQAPVGYVTDKREYPVIVAVDGKTVKIADQTFKVTVQGKVNIAGIYELKNKPQTVLPSTGGRGPIVYWIVSGILFMLLFVTGGVYWLKRRHDKN